MPRWIPELVVSLESVSPFPSAPELTRSPLTPSSHLVELQLSPIRGHEKRLYSKYFNPNDVSSLFESCCDVMMSCLYRFILGDCISESRLIVDKHGFAMGCASVEMNGFFDVSCLNNPTPEHRRLIDQWALNPVGLIKIPLVAWVLGDNDLHHHNIGWSFVPQSDFQPEQLIFSKIDHGFIYHELHYFHDFKRKIKHGLLSMAPQEITLEKIINFPLGGTPTDYGRYWPFRESHHLTTRPYNRTTRTEALFFTQIWERFNQDKAPNNLLLIEKATFIMSLAALIFSKNWKSLCKYLLNELPKFCGPYGFTIHSALKYILINVIEHRLRMFSHIYNRAPLEVKTRLVPIETPELIRLITQSSHVRTLSKHPCDDDITNSVEHIGFYHHAKFLSRWRKDVRPDSFIPPKNHHEYLLNTNRYKYLSFTKDPNLCCELFQDSKSIKELHDFILSQLSDSHSSLNRSLIGLNGLERSRLIASILSGNGMSIFYIATELNLVNLFVGLDKKFYDPIDVRRIPEHTQKSVRFLNQVCIALIKTLLELEPRQTRFDFFAASFQLLNWPVECNECRSSLFIEASNECGLSWSRLSPALEELLDVFCIEPEPITQAPAAIHGATDAGARAQCDSDEDFVVVE